MIDGLEVEKRWMITRRCKGETLNVKPATGRGETGNRKQCISVENVDRPNGGM